MVKKLKKSNPSTGFMLPPQLRSLSSAEEYERQREDYCMYKKQRGVFEYTEVFLDKLAYNLLDWARQNPIDKAFRICDYYIPLNIPRREWWVMMQKSPLLKEANETAKEIIARNREWGSASGLLKETTVLATLGIYDKEFRTYLQWKAKLGIEEGNRSQTIIINKTNLSGVEEKHVKRVESSAGEDKEQEEE